MANEAGNDSSFKGRMPVEAALARLSELRGADHVVVTNQASARLWPRLSHHELDFNYNPSTMSGAVPFALGLALAQPDREVIVLSGDGSLLMSLGCLVTVIGSGVTNLTIILLDNGMYEVTGGQRTPSWQANTDYAGLARGAGFPNVVHCRDLDDWQHRASDVLPARGPRFIWLEVGPTPAADLQDPTPCLPITEQVTRLKRALDR